MVMTTYAGTVKVKLVLVGSGNQMNWKHRREVDWRPIMARFLSWAFLLMRCAVTLKIYNACLLVWEQEARVGPLQLLPTKYKSGFVPVEVQRPVSYSSQWRSGIIVGKSYFIWSSQNATRKDTTVPPPTRSEEETVSTTYDRPGGGERGRPKWDGC